MADEMKKNDATQPATPEGEQHDTVPNTLRDDAAHGGSSGPLFGIVIIVLVLIAGGVYFWFTKVDESNQSEQQLPTIPSSDETTDAVVEELQTQSSSDEIDAIEEDLNTTDLENIDAELDDILNEL